MEGNTAKVSVRFVSEQLILVRDSSDNVVEGDPTQIDVVTDDWTFSRDVTSRNPNWFLSVTSSPDR
jgi:predicted lipid-binding transport protein (Tim44 family)